VIKYKKHNKQKIAKMDSQVLERKKQELELDDFIRSTSDPREIKRALVVKWSWSGRSYRQIIKLLNVSLGFISKWNNKFSIWGVKGLKMAYKGKQGYLSKSEKAEIILWLSHREREHVTFAVSNYTHAGCP
jgi:transposase